MHTYDRNHNNQRTYRKSSRPNLLSPSRSCSLFNVLFVLVTVLVVSLNSSNTNNNFHWVVTASSSSSSSSSPTPTSSARSAATPSFQRRKNPVTISRSPTHTPDLIRQSAINTPPGTPSLPSEETQSLLSATTTMGTEGKPDAPATGIAAGGAAAAAAGGGMPEFAKLLIGAGGIYAAFLYYGSLQEDVFRFVSPDGTSFKQAWFLQVLEALANVVIGFIGMQLSCPTKGIPLPMFAISGAAQVSAKACTSLSLANGLSFPVATLAKSGKMAPVMLGSLLLGGATYSVREYLQVAAIIGGTAIVSLGKKKGGDTTSTSMGVFYIIMSLVLDGVTAGFQKRLKTETAKVGVKPKPYDFMFWTNLFMCLTAAVIAGVLGEIQSGTAFLVANPEILNKIIKFAVCSAVGQSFIFYTIANFDPLVLSTVTTTRKIFSVLLSIFLKGHSLSVMGWSGIAMACGGIMSELQAKTSKKKKHSS